MHAVDSSLAHLGIIYEAERSFTCISNALTNMAAC